MSQRLVLVDDTSSDIQYNGPWFEVQNTQLDTGNWGPPFENTLHGVNVSASMSFSFSGAQVIVLGTTITTNISWSQDPTWECFIDNASIGWNTVLVDPENNWVLCEDSHLPDGPHVLRVQVTVSNQQTFWFDQIQYLPFVDVSLDQSIVRIGSTDEAVQYSSGWQPLANIANYTQTEGSSLTLDFSGVSVYLGGFIPSDFPLNNSSATYTIDNQPSITFVVPALTSTTALPLYNQMLFQIGNLSTGNHKLVVTYQGNSETAPLAINYFVVQDAPSPSTSSTGGGTTTGTATHSSSAPTGTSYNSTGTSFNSTGTSSNSTSSQGSTSKKSPIAAIAGGASGGLILLLLFMFLIRRRKNRKTQRLSNFDLNSEADVDAFHEIVQPFTLPPSHSTSLHSHQTINSNLSQSRQLTDAPLTTSQVALTSSQMAGSSSVSVSAPTPLRNRPPASPTTTIYSSPYGGIASSQTNLTDGGMTRKAREAEAARLESGPPEPRGDARFLRHEDSGVRIAPAEEDIVELPPLYTIG